MLDVSKETNVGFLRAATKLLQEKVLFLEKQLIQQQAIQKADAELCAKLSDELLVLKKKFFKGGAERVKNTSKKNKRRKAQNDLIIHNHRPFDQLQEPVGTLESEDVVYDAREDETLCPVCKGAVVSLKNAFEESMEVHVVEKKYVLRRHKRQKYQCSCCSKIGCAPGPTKLVDGGEFSIHMAVEVACDKFEHHIPLNRQAQMMGQRGLKVDTKTLFSLTQHLMVRLNGVPTRIQAEIKRQGWVHLDESPCDIMLEHQKGYVWTMSNNFGAYYQYELTRSGAVAKEMLSHYRGVVMTDAFQGYNFLESHPDIILTLCWSHVRRKFVDAMDGYPRAETVVNLIDELYEIEHKATSLEHLLQLRKSHSSAVVQKIESWMKDQQGKYLDTVGVGKAITYTKEYWHRLTLFLENPCVPFDNNAGERSQRSAVMGRKNFNGFRTINGADVGMFFYTIINTCKLLTLVPKAYLLEMAHRSARKQEVWSPFEYAEQISRDAAANQSYLEVFQKTYH